MSYEFDGVFQENISNEIAMALLAPNEYDPLCRYQLVTLEDGQYVVKIDDRITPEAEAENIKLDPTTDKRRMTEYKLEETTDECMSLEDLYAQVGLSTVHIPVANQRAKKEFNTMCIVAGVIIGLMLLWFMLFVFVILNL